MRSIFILFMLVASCGSTEVPGAPGTPDAGGAVDAQAGSCDEDGDGHESTECGGSDCNDDVADVYPSAVDICDGEDNDCDGRVDQDGACECAELPPAPTLAFTDRVCLQGGWFAMGMGETDPHAHKLAHIAVPVHRVFVAPFYLDKYEVTNRRYIACMDAGVCAITTPTGAVRPWKLEDNSTPEASDKPFWAASIKDAKSFCEWAGGWLPSEAQWERAAAGLGDRPRPYPHGDEPATCDQEWTVSCVPENEQKDFPLARRVGMKLPNPEGVYDLGGNVMEWTADLFSAEAYQNCPEPCKNPCFGCADKTGGDPNFAPSEEYSSEGHVNRGNSIGKVSNMDVFARSQYRDLAVSGPRAQLFNQGFRCAYPAKPKR